MTRLALAFLLLGVPSLAAADPVFSGPQPGERITPFRVLNLAPNIADAERDPVAEATGTHLAFVFVHTIERSLVPLLRAIDEYAAESRDRFRTEIIFLSADRLEGERRVRAANGSLKLKSPVGLSLDGAEGPGNYGLNRDCMMTLLLARDLQVLTNFALVQPGIADAPAVLSALARLTDDPRPLDLKRFTERPNPRDPQMRPNSAQPNENFPGAVPTDPRLNQLVRLFIRATNDVATVDRLLTDLNAHLRDHPDLTRQAADAWIRILHFGDRYGTPYARDTARTSLQELEKSLKSSAPAPAPARP